MSEKAKKIFKPIGIIIAVLLVAVCIAVDVWYLCILQYSPKKVAMNTTYVGMQKAEDGVSASPFKVKYNSNKKKNGYEVLSIQFNYLRDEEASGLVTQGVQYETSNISDALEFYTYDSYEKDVENKSNVDKLFFNTSLEEKGFTRSYEKKKLSNFLWTGHYNGVYINPFLKNGIKNNYQLSSIDGKTYTNSMNPIGNSTYFTFQTTEGSTEDMIYLRLRGDNYSTFDSEAKEVKADVDSIGYAENEDLFNSSYTWYFNNFTMDWFANLIYNSVKDLPSGSNGYFIFELGHYFDIYKVNADKSVGEQIMDTDSTKVQNLFKEYFVFEVEVTEDGARSSIDTLFGYLQGQSNYRIEGYTGTDGDYFSGENVIDVTYKAFDLVKYGENNVTLKLKEDFISAYLPYKKTITLNIVIDTNEITKLGYNFIGFEASSGLENFKINKTEVI